MQAADLGSAAFFSPSGIKEKNMSSAFLEALARVDAITCLGLFSLVLAALVSAATLVRHALRAGKPS
jgi:hypothetical protein